MKQYAEISTATPEKFNRMVGICKEDFQQLLTQIADFISCEKSRNPLKKRGRKPTLSLENRLLLTLYYQRHYPTFDVLSSIFGICESYCQKIYTQQLRILAKIQTLPNHKEQLENSRAVVVVDVTEQPIERPVKKQKQYFSGKKTPYC